MKFQFLHHSLKTYATQLAQTVLLTLIAICTARLLGPTNKGIYSILVLIPMMVVTLGRCGLGNAVIYFCGRFDLWWIPVWGIAGAAMASSIAYLTATVMIIVMYRKLTGIRLGDLLIPQKNDFRLLRETFRRTI